MSSKYKLMNLFNEYFGRRSYVYKFETDEKSIQILYDIAVNHYGIKTTPEEVKEVLTLFFNTLNQVRNGNFALDDCEDVIESCNEKEGE